MTGHSRRIIVGVSESLAGLQAIRTAVATARGQAAELVAVRGWTYPTAGGTEFISATLGLQMSAGALATIGAAFAAAMGGYPADIAIRLLADHGAPAHVILSQVTSTADLIVLGRPAGLFGFGRAQVIGRCSRQAPCPVLVVPPPEMATKTHLSLLVRDLHRGAETLIRHVRTGA